MSNFSKVGIFMKTFGQEVKENPSFSTDKINKLRIDLIKEELDEKCVWSDVLKAKKILKFEAKTKIETGIKKIKNQTK